MTHSSPGAAELPVDTVLAQSLKDIGIPPRPAILDRIALEMDKEEPDFKRLATLIGADVSLAAALIKTANSPFFGTRGRVRSATEALMVLGLNVSSRAIAGIILRQVFPPSPAMERFWDASARIARLAGWLVQEVIEVRLRAEDAYTFGLFRDCGIPVLMRRFPNYGNILAAANKEEVKSFTEIEEHDLPTNHAMVGCMLAQSWWLPEETCLAIRYHHDHARLDIPMVGMPPVSRQLIAVAQFAEALIQQETGLSQTREWEKLGDACLRLVGIDAAELPAIGTLAKAVLEADE